MKREKGQNRLRLRLCPPKPIHFNRQTVDLCRRRRVEVEAEVEVEDEVEEED
jgi:hypothetical protein